jgi:hypothetical protein
VGTFAGGALFAGAAAPAMAGQKHPHLRAALGELRDAKKELKQADHDFQGHRAAAIKAIDEAIKQIEICINLKK